MNELLQFLALAVVAGTIIALGWWLLIASEGVYLGRRTVVWLYDRYANRYDDIKAYQAENEYYLLARPLLERIAPLKSPLVLDVATGTGRLPLALINHPDFQGRVIGLDLSRRMLANAAHKLGDVRERAALIWQPAENLPFADDTFDVATCLESLEFMVNPEGVLTEIVRVLRPSGQLLITNRIDTRLMPGKTWSNAQLADLLGAAGIEAIGFEIWQVDYNKVWGRKRGHSQPTGARPLGEVLRCPCRRDEKMIEDAGYWYCEGCKARARVGADGVVELYQLSQSERGSC